ncbi:MAG: hypothetical protein CMG46_08085 [Candidatus Marinimicrobia bacterium]|nr:hypothetical protein [Candidatus Neomarinimicrobiota bacterium]
MDFRLFEGEMELVGALCEAVALALVERLKTAAEAGLVVSGGKSVRAFLGEFPRVFVPWTRIYTTLSDERWVAPNSVHSNEHQLRQLFHRGRAAKSIIVGLKTSGRTPQEGLVKAQCRLHYFPFPAAATVLGFGADGHVASLFPGGEYRQGSLVSTHSPDFPRHRISMSMAMLSNTSHLFILAPTTTKGMLIKRFLSGGLDCPIVNLIRMTNRVTIFSRI